MDTMTVETQGTIAVCAVQGCQSPRAVWSGGAVQTKCDEHLHEDCVAARAVEAAARKVTTDAFAATLARVAGLLGWTVRGPREGFEPTPSAIYLDAMDKTTTAGLLDARLYCQIDLYQKKGRITIAGGFTQEQHKARSYDHPKHEITVSSDATAERIAGEIKRRLLPGYIAELATVGALADKTSRGAKLARELDVSTRHMEPGATAAPLLYYRSATVTGSCHDGETVVYSVKVDASLDHAQARKLLALLPEG